MPQNFPPLPPSLETDDAMSSATPHATGRFFSALGAKVGARPLAAGLYLVATPIGNLGDMTIRALETLAAADVILVEDRRVSAVLLKHYGITTPMLNYHEHNAEEMRPQILSRLAAHQVVALISDAGTPLVSDPGYRLVQDCVAGDHLITALPGASAVLTGLILSGLPTDRFFYAGFLPQKSAERRSKLHEIIGIPATLIFYEAPHRIAETLEDAAVVFGNRSAAIGRELTKKFEEIRRGTLQDLAAFYASAPKPKGEIVLIIGGASADQPILSETSLDNRLRALLEKHSTKDAAAILSAETGIHRKELYARALIINAG
jgi:16S rRNA (cytidine1402-2'-O)-methyltransferase